MRRARGIVLAVLTLLAAPGSRALGEPAAPDSAAVEPEEAGMWQEAPVGDLRHHRLESLVPELADHPYRLEPGRRQFVNRFSISPGYGTLGSNRFFTLRAAYNPNQWLGYEAALGHNPAHAVHAVLHTLSAIVRRPSSGRMQPYLAGGYGMMIVFPGQATNAASVTKNALVMGGGLELYIRNDLALRADLRDATVFGQQRGREGVVAYDYLQGTIGLAFYRSIRP